MRTSAGLLLLSALAGGWLWAGGNSSTANAMASIRIVRPLALSNIQGLYFGALLVEPGSAGRLIKQHAAHDGGTRDTDPAGVTQVAQSTEHWHNAEFEIRGEPGANFSVYLPKGNILLKAPSGSGTSSMPVIGLNYQTDSAIDPSGLTKMWIGGTLQLPADPAPGHYREWFPVTVAYY